MPLLNLVGLNGNNRTIHLGVALMRHRKEAGFVWVFESLKTKLNTEGLSISLFVTDNDDGCINALNRVFNNPKITMCRWHMNKDILLYVRAALATEFGRHQEGNRWVDNQSTTDFMELYYRTLRSKTIADFDINLKAIKDMSNTAYEYLC